MRPDSDNDDAGRDRPSVSSAQIAGPRALLNKVVISEALGDTVSVEQEKAAQRCPQCRSLKLVKNGHNAVGNQQYQCKDCGKRGVLSPSLPYTAEEKAQILAAYYERPSLRGTARSFGVARQTLVAWLKQSARVTR